MGWGAGSRPAATDADGLLLPLLARNFQPGAYGFMFAAKDRGSDSGVVMEEVSQHVASMAMMEKKDLEKEHEVEVQETQIPGLNHTKKNRVKGKSPGKKHANF